MKAASLRMGHPNAWAIPQCLRSGGGSGHEPCYCRDSLLSDAAKLSAWRPILGVGVHVRIGSRPPALGHVTALNELGVLLDSVQSIGGRCREVWDPEEATLVETEIVCGTAKALARSTNPCALIFRTGGRPPTLDVRFYLDRSPMFRTRFNGAWASNHGERAWTPERISSPPSRADQQAQRP